MTYYVDGFVLDRNPSPRGGGFTVVDETGKHIKTHTIFQSKPWLTNNDTELLAIGYAAFIAQPGDTIITDSQPAKCWVESGYPKARRDLIPMASRIKRWVKEKRLTLNWVPRDENLAGHHNETMERA
jgi:ribonuclease HI